MKKRIILCSDGTGNSAIKGRGTNVFKLYEAINTSVTSNQYAFYDDGVGTERWKPLKLLGGAFGLGLARNVRQLYASLCRVYQEDDDIYLFGFSRGAFTVRTLAGFILKIGVIRREGISDTVLCSRIEEAYDLYRDFAGIPPKKDRTRRQQEKWDQAEKEAEAFRQKYCTTNWAKLKIRFIGVWDTVDAYGTPSDAFTELLNKVFHFKFSDRTLSDRVKIGRHAVSIDDERRTFHPVLWAQSQENEDRIKQVWFAGVHSNVGGGYPKQGMSLVTLDWMMEEAEAMDLEFVKPIRESYRQVQNVNDKLYNSRMGLATYYAYKPRDIAELSREKVGTERPLIHESVIRRITSHTDGYAPGGIPASFRMEYTRPPKPEGEDEWEQSVRAGYEASDGKGPLMVQYSKLITGRRFAQMFFMSFSAASLLLALITPSPDWAGVKWVGAVAGFLLPSWAAEIMVRMFGNPYALAVIASCGILAWSWGTILRRKQEHLYSQFWNNVQWTGGA